jgi:hypothetical protein
MTSREGKTIMSVRKYFGLFGLACLVLASAIVFPAVASDCLSSSFCNTVETGSSMVLTVGNLNTEMGVRLAGNSGAGTGIYNNVVVSEYAPGVPSEGTVTAFIRGRTMQEGQVVDFNDVTSIIGKISTFSKFMSFGSKFS